MNKIFAFWESKDGTIPAYLELCKQTWIKNIPNVEIHILNYTNLESYIGDTYPLEQLKKISLAMQSDIISAAVLEKFGGLFLDLDCIVVDDIFSILSSISQTKLIGFGRKPNAIHLAVLYSALPNNPILKIWRETAQIRLKELPAEYKWDYFGNAIINPLFLNEQYKNDFYIINRTESGNILESAITLNSDLNNQRTAYLNTYFNPYFSINHKVCDVVSYGVISLHNSWTPTEYKDIKNIRNFLYLDIPLVDILKMVLNGSWKSNNKNKLQVLSSYLDSELVNLQLKMRFFKEILVLDFTNGLIKFAFDIKYCNDNLYAIDLIFRDEQSFLAAKNIKMENIKLENTRKINIVSLANKEKLAKIISDLYSNLNQLS